MKKYWNMLKEKLTSLVKGGFFHILVGNTLTKMLTFISSIVIVRLVSKEDFAYLSYSDNLYLYIIAISGLGMSSAVLKYCGSQFEDAKDKAYIIYALKNGTIIELLLSVAIVIYVWLADIPFPQARELVSLMILYPAMNYMVATFQSYARARMDNKLFAKLALVQSTVVLFVSICLVKILGINGMAYSRYIAMAICCVIGFRFINQQVGNCQVASLSKDEKKQFLTLSLSFMFASLFSMIMPINETFLVNNMIKDEIVSANYKVAMLIPSQTMFVSNSIAVYFFGILNRIKDKKELWSMLKKIELLSAGIITLVTIAGMIVYPYMVKIFYGERYMDSIELSNCYWIVYAINSGFRLVALNLIPAVGNAKVSAVVSVISAILHLIICYFGIERYGVYGAMIALGVVYILAGIIYWIYLYQYCHMKK